MIIKCIKQRMKACKRFIINIYYIIIHGRQFTLAVACDIDLSKLDRSVRINHPVGVVIGAPERIGKDCIIRQNVTIGAKYGCRPRYPTLEHSVEVGAGAIIIGDVIVGNNSYIGANAVVLKNVPAYTTVVGVWK